MAKHWIAKGMPEGVPKQRVSRNGELVGLKYKLPDSVEGTCHNGDASTH
jgi:hypothetical protein